MRVFNNGLGLVMVIDEEDTDEVLLRLKAISNNKKHDFQKKLNLILKEIVKFMEVSSGSIMLMKNRKTREVIASTKPHIIGQTQSISNDSP